MSRLKLCYICLFFRCRYDPFFSRISVTKSHHVGPASHRHITIKTIAICSLFNQMYFDMQLIWLVLTGIHECQTDTLNCPSVWMCSVLLYNSVALWSTVDLVPDILYIKVAQKTCNFQHILVNEECAVIIYAPHSYFRVFSIRWRWNRWKKIRGDIKSTLIIKHYLFRLLAIFTL